MRLAAFQPDIAPNLGALIRLGACFGAPVDVIEPCGFPLSAAALRRAAMDYAMRAEVVRHDGWSAYLAARPPGRLVLLTTAGDEDLWRFAFRPDDHLMVGRESAGAPQEVHSAADVRLRVPLRPGLRSLNMAMAAGMALSEALRQHPPGWAQVSAG